MKCKGCEKPVTWAQSREQFGRLVGTKLVSPMTAKALLPRCGKCVTQWINRPTNCTPMMNATELR